MERKKNLGTAALAVATLFVSASSLLNKLALAEGLHPVWVNALRISFSCILTTLPLLFRPSARRALRAAPKKERFYSMLSGALLAAHFVCWVFALRETDALAATAIWSTYVLMTAALSAIVFRERLPRAAYMALILATAGVALTGSGAGGYLKGNLYALGAAVSQALYTLAGRRVRRRVDALSYTAIVYASALVALLLCALALRVPPTGLNIRSVSASLGLAVFCTILGHSMCSYALRFIPAPTVSAAMLTEVVSGPLLVFLALGERPNAHTLAGGAVILAGVALYIVAARGTGEPQGDAVPRTPCQRG